MAIDKLVDSGQLNGALSSIANAIREKGGTFSPLTFPNGFIEAIENIETGGSSAPFNDVNFYDYDGTIVYSYTTNEFAQLAAMPTNPNHSNDAVPLTSLGWNWTLVDAKAYVAKYNKLDIGQMYKTTDNKTHILIHLNEGRTSPMLGCCPNGTVDVDWGDGTAHDTLSGTSEEEVVWTQNHNYAAPGNYDIALTCNGTMGLCGDSDTEHGLLQYSVIGDDRNIIYDSAVLHVRLADNVTNINNYAFYSCRFLTDITISNSVINIGEYALNSCLKLVSLTIPNSVTNIGDYALSHTNFTSITIPNSVTSIGNYAFSECLLCPMNIAIPDSVTSISRGLFIDCSLLTSVIIPDSVTTIGDTAFMYCVCLANITIPDSVTSIGGSAFFDCYCLTNIIIPDSVIMIEAGAFGECGGAVAYHIISTTPPTLADSNVFYNMSDDCVIYVPRGSLETYQDATNWADLYDYIQEEPI